MTTLISSPWSLGRRFSVVRDGFGGTEMGKVTASDGVSNDLFGSSVAISSNGNTVCIGSVGHKTKRGAVYVFERAGNSWVQQAKLEAPDAVDNDSFGNDVAVSSDGNMLLIGSPMRDKPGYSNNGGVYAYERTGSTWTYKATIISATNSANMYFGYSLSISGDGNTALIGGYGANGGQSELYKRTGSTWNYVATLTESQQNALGKDVAISSNGLTLAIADPDANNKKGYVYVKTFDGNNTVTAQTTLAGVASNGYFGSSVALSTDGNTLVVGANGENAVSGSTSNNTGVAYVYTRSGSTWTEQQRISVPSIAIGAKFGSAASLSGDGNLLVVGANGENVVSDTEGAAYVFNRSAGVWSQIKKLTDVSPTAKDIYGFAVAMSLNGLYVAVGSPQDDDRATDAGSVCIFA